MAKYEKHPRQKGKYQCPVCDYGHAVGKSRQAVTAHYNKHHADLISQSAGENGENDSVSSNVIPDASISDTLSTSEVNSPVDPELNDDTKPNWLNFSLEGEEEVDSNYNESLPPIATSVLSHWYQSGGFPQTQEGLQAFYKQQARMMRWFFNGVVDPLFSWYGKAVTSNEKFEITRNAQEWELFEGISQQWLEYRQIVLPVTPDVMMAGCVGSFYVPQVWNIHKNRDKSKTFGFRGMYQRWKLKRKLKREARRNPLNENKDEAPYA